MRDKIKEGEKMSPVADLAKEITEEVLGPSPLKIGQRLKHESGCLVEITDGEYWGEDGLSNFWDWIEILPDGTRGRRGCGYGNVNEQGALEGGKWLKGKKGA